MSEELPKGWCIAPISALVGSKGLMKDGDWIESKDQDPNGEVRLVQLADIGEGAFFDKSNRWLTDTKARHLNCTFIQEGDLLISRLGDPLGKACVAPSLRSPSVTVVDVHVFRSGSMGVSHRWLMHSLNAHVVRASIESQSSGTTRKRITGKKLKNLELPIPPSAEQLRIASRVDELFSSIDEGERALERVRKLVERYRQSVLKAAVTGELTREWRQHHAGELESGEALLIRILEARRQAWEQSELAKMEARDVRPTNDSWKKKYEAPQGPEIDGLADLPDEWVWSSLGQLFQVHGGSTPSRKQPEYWNGNIPWVSSGEVAFCRIDKTEECISDAGYENSSVKLHPAGTVLLAMIGEGKTRGQAAILSIPACHNQNAASIRVSATPIPPEYVYHLLKLRYEQTRAVGQGGNQPALNGEIVKSITVPLPPLAELTRICEVIESQMASLDAIEASIVPQRRFIEAQRQTILREAFAGRLVPQDPNDEPASILLERIAAERAATPKRAVGKPARTKKTESKAKA